MHGVNALCADDPLQTVSLDILSDLILFMYMLTCMLSLLHVVANQIDAGVMQLIVERTAVTLETMSNDSHVICWGCNVFAHAASNGEWVAVVECILSCTQAQE